MRITAGQCHLQSGHNKIQRWLGREAGMCFLHSRIYATRRETSSRVVTTGYFIGTWWPWRRSWWRCGGFHRWRWSWGKRWRPRTADKGQNAVTGAAYRIIDVVHIWCVVKANRLVNLFVEFRYNSTNSREIKVCIEFICFLNKFSTT